MAERLNVSQFAKAEGCDEKQVRRAIERGALHRGEDGLLDSALVASGWRKPNRRTMLKSPDNNPDNSKLSEVVRKTSSQPVVRPTARDGESTAEAAARFLSADIGMLDYAQALEKKENYLALLRQLEYEHKSGSLVDLETASAILFEESRAQRDAWLNWPARIGPILAADLGLEADRVVEALTAHVHKQIAQLGEPEANFSPRDG
jgi:hypothetical protein